MASRISQMRNAAPQPQQPSLAIEPVRNLMHQLQNAPNARELLFQTLANNPNMQPIMNIMQSNGDLESLARAIAQQRGVNLNELVKQLLKINV